MRRVHVVVTGDVQGVGYRYSLEQVATDAGVSGWVRNRYDGSVEAEIEGTGEQVDRVLAWMARGPRWGRVREAAVTDTTPAGGSGFEVRRDG